MSDKDYPIASIIEGTRSAFSGVLALYLGLIGGSVIVVAGMGGALWEEWALLPIAWLGLASYATVQLWGLLLIPLLIVMLYGLVGKEWNRWIGGAITAICFAVICLLGVGINPFQSAEAPWLFGLTAGSALLILLLGSLWEFLRRR